MSEISEDVTADGFISRWAESGGAELANFQSFATELCDLLSLPHPDPSTEDNSHNNYVFERRIDFKHPDGTTSPGRIDLYKRNCFVLEAKQAAKRTQSKDPDQLELMPEDASQPKLGTAKRGTGGWDTAMVKARKQAENYARALPVEHGYPPFIIVADVGNVIEVFADFSGQGKNYAHFPDRQSYRIALGDLNDDAIRERLSTIWTDPQSLDPTRKSAEVTRDIADRLAKIAKRLEKQHDAKDVAEFLMRCVFTMFAEDVGLLPKDGFSDLLLELQKTPANFRQSMESLWAIMDKGGYAPHLNQTLKRFNGGLFKTHKAIDLDADDIHELWIAANRDWQDVEPAIFGTLLERALDDEERSRLGAHYTPRAYVERLVIPTIIEPLRADWEEVQARVQDLQDQGDPEAAFEAAKAFHHKLCTTRVLDPACGTGNFLYVSLELMKRLEGEVLDALDDLGKGQERLDMRGEMVNPSQFYGLELNPRAVAIADLVLWIGYLKWQLRTSGVDSINDPVLDAYGTIQEQDAILAYDKHSLVRDSSGKPVTIWDGRSMRPHPVTGEMVPDETAQKETYTYTNPRPAAWPEVEFIVGNPPFIGGKDMRAELGDGYAEAAWKARPKIPGGADFVMHFWDQAATLLCAKDSVVQRFGFITTNSATQVFSRRVIERHISGSRNLSLIFAVADHPWLKAADKAAVRIAMTVAERGSSAGILAVVSSEADLNSDSPKVDLEEARGVIHANLRHGANLAAAKSLHSNEGISSAGVKLHGAGFIVSQARAAELIKGSDASIKNHIVDYRNGKDLAQRPRNSKVIDFYPLTAEEARLKFPLAYQHVLEHVKPERDQNRDLEIKTTWWQFGRVRTDFRDFTDGLPRYIATIETAKHRFFQFLDADIRPDNRLVNFGIDSATFLSTLYSRLHVCWALAVGGLLEDRPIYTKTTAFDPFPFPAFGVMPPELPGRLQSLGERLDEFRKERLEAHEFLTMTSLYNVQERLRELENDAPVEPLSGKERDIHDAGLISVLKEIHDDIDRAVFEAYGWNDLIPALVGKPGATTPSMYKLAEQEEAEEELLSRLTDLNRARALEEEKGIVHWLRPEYQIPKLGHKVQQPDDGQQIEAEISILDPDKKRKWPADGLAQIRIVRDILTEVEAPAVSESISAIFSGRNTQKRKDRVEKVLETLVSTGAAQAGIMPGDGSTGYFVPR